MRFAYRVELSDEQEDEIVGLCQELRSRLFHEGKLSSGENKRVVAYFEKNLHTLSLPFMALVNDKEKVSAALVSAYKTFLTCTTLHHSNFPENLPLAQPALGVYKDMFSPLLGFASSKFKPTVSSTIRSSRNSPWRCAVSRISTCIALTKALTKDVL